jgi:hypothetical protein
MSKHHTMTTCGGVEVEYYKRRNQIMMSGHLYVPTP